MGARRDALTTHAGVFIVCARSQDCVAVFAVRWLKKRPQHATGFRKELRQPERISNRETERK